jgi:hypothetical protein
MQKDFMNMAQGAKATGANDLSPEDLTIDEAGYEEMGLPAGDSPEAIKERIMQMLKDMGVFEELAPTEKQELMQLVEQLIADIQAQNFEAVEQNPVMQLLGSAFEALGAEEVGEESAAGGMSPADMVGMAGGGGGMPGGGMPPMPGGGM